MKLQTPRFVLTTLPQGTVRRTTEVLVIGGGAAGLTAALSAAERSAVTLLVRGSLVESNSAWAQGGIAAALDSGDSPRFHIEDTLVAGAGLCDRAAVETLAWEAPGLMREMAALGVPFEREGEAQFALGLEGGHTHRRILHVGDATGWALTSILIQRVQAHPRIRILEGYQVVDLLGEGRCTGVLARDAAGGWHRFLADATILATGGAGALYGLTSNQAFALGEGIAMAFRAGAEVADMEFVQFHPTVMRLKNGHGFLISEAARGEGGRLFSLTGRRFMPAYDPRNELAPRDIVTRGIYAAMQAEGSDHVVLDLTHLTRDYLERRFPTIFARCLAEGIDPSCDPIPVAPASHYLMGGIRTDLQGATRLPGLFAAGECACTGVHGANRLASNSLLECLVFGRRAGRAASQMVGRMQGAAMATTQAPITLMPADKATSHTLDQLQAIMREGAGPRRSGAGLTEAQAQLANFPLQIKQFEAAAITLANATLAAQLIVGGALLREESRGGHFRSDFPQSSDDRKVHIILARGRNPVAAETIAAPSEVLASVGNSAALRSVALPLVA